MESRSGFAKGAPALVLAVWLLGGAAGAQAAATAGAFSNAILTVSGPTLPDLIYTVDTDSFSLQDFSGAAESTVEASPFASAVSTGGTDILVDLIADTFTSADAPPVSDAFGEAGTSAFVTIFNDGAAAVDIDVLLEVHFDAFAVVDAPLVEDATAEASVALLSDSGGLLAEIIGSADALLGPPDDFMDGILHDSTITLAPGESVALDLFNDTTATAISAVPVPAALPLLGSALLLGAPLARRRMAAASEGPRDGDKPHAALRP